MTRMMHVDKLQLRLHYSRCNMALYVLPRLEHGHQNSQWSDAERKGVRILLGREKDRAQDFQVLLIIARFLNVLKSLLKPLQVIPILQVD